MKTVAILPLRSDSQRIRHKNLKLVAGHPLFTYQVRCAQEVEEVAEVVVVSDSVECRRLALELGASVLDRPTAVSGPQSKTEEVIDYALGELEKAGRVFDAIVVLQATSPLNRPEWIAEGLEKLHNGGGYQSVVTYTDFGRFFLDDDDLLERPMSQERPGRKMETGNFWITKVEAFRREKNRIVAPYAEVKVDRWSGLLDIDEEEDLRIAEQVLLPQVREREGRYYRKREYAGDFEDYWAPKEDPDGKLRDISRETQHKLDFCRDEIDFINGLPDLAGKRILDLGCGVGTISQGFHDDYDKYGLEVSVDGAERAKEIIPNVHIGPLEKETYPEEFFDVIFCSHVIEHVPHPESFVRHTHRCMKTHGHLVMSTPNFDSGAARRFGENFRLLHDKTHISLFSDTSLRELLEDNGFLVDRIEYPFFETEYFTPENLERMFDTAKVSPAFYGNVMTLYCRKK